MSDPKQRPTFREQIRSRLNLAQSELQQEREVMDQVMAGLEQREEIFNQLATQLCMDILSPTMEDFAEYFDNAQLEDVVTGHCVRCHLQHSPRFPAKSHIEFRVTHNETIELLTIQFEAQILPVFINFERKDSLDLTIQNVDLVTVRHWAEQKVLGFLDSYMQIETNEQYQRDNSALDPVCGMRVSKPKGLSYEYDGQLYYFCAQRCMDRFINSPSGFVHSPNQ